MPADLLQRVVGPTAYSSAWWWLALLLVAKLTAWYAGVLVWTMSGRRLRDTPVIGGLRARIARHRHAKAVREIGDRYRAGELDSAPACAAVSRLLRDYLGHVTGVRAEYMQLDDIADSALANAAALFAELSDAQFNDESRVDASRASADAEELIRSWI
ncbi:MAG: hypothetical protein QOJ80_5770 [Mycobacterium sp.]|nr:hypothetical protein [Mycobacterium sp.]